MKNANARMVTAYQTYEKIPRYLDEQINKYNCSNNTNSNIDIII